MPDLGAKLQTTRLNLPSSTPDDPAWVELKSQVVLGDFVAVQEIEGQFEQGVVLLSRVIADWNFTLNGEKAPITAKTLELLSADDFIFLSKWVDENIKIDEAGGITPDQKKSFSSTLATSSTATSQAPPASQPTSIPIN